MRQISSDKIENFENQAVKLLKKILNQCQKKKIHARVIIFIVVGIAVIEELFAQSGLSNNWREITVYSIMGYMGMATYRSIFKM